MGLNKEQRSVLSGYLGNLSIAWFAAGVISPIVSKQDFDKSWRLFLISLFVAVVLLYFMIELLKGDNKK